MKVNLEYESIDADGEKQLSKVAAIMEVRKDNYKLTFIEDLSGEGKTTRSTMYLSPENMRIIRKGELNTDFMFGPALVHNTNYATPYGNLPVTITTKDFSFLPSHPDILGDNMLSDVSLPADFSLNVSTSYDIEMNGAKMPMSMRVRVTL